MLLVEKFPVVFAHLATAVSMMKTSRCSCSTRLMTLEEVKSRIETELEHSERPEIADVAVPETETERQICYTCPTGLKSSTMSVVVEHE